MSTRHKSIKKRELNLELLRIIGMLAIVIFHFSDWGGLLKINIAISPNKLLGEFINIGGSFGNDIFILISGYFLVNSKFKTKKLLKIVLEILFYSILMYIVCVSFGIVEYNIYDVKRSIFPISYNMYWFATLYVVIYLLSPFINLVVNNINKKQHLTLIIVLGIFISVIPSILIDSNIFSDNFIRFIFLYIIAAYIKKYSKTYNKKNVLVLIIFSILTLFAISFIYTQLGIDEYITIYNNMTSVPMLLLTISTFVFFKDLKVNNESKIIPFFAKASFAVYLIHINIYFKKYLFNNILRIQKFYYVNTLYLALYILLASIIIYMVCTIIDTIRRKILEEPLFKMKAFDKFFIKIDKLLDISIKM